MLSRKAAFFEVVGLKVGFACTVPIKAIRFYPLLFRSKISWKCNQKIWFFSTYVIYCRGTWSLLYVVLLL